MDTLKNDKAFNIAKNLKYDGYQHGLSSMAYKYFGKKCSGSSVKSEIIPNQAEELKKKNNY